MTEEMWRAIHQSDASWDGKFFYGVTTTKIFCRPSCKSRQPNREHVHLFASSAEALAGGFRPCKRCKPEGLRLPDEEWVDQIAETIRNLYREPLTLDSLAGKMHASPYHMHRTFKRITGTTPAEYIQLTRIAAAKALLEDTALPVGEVALKAGYTNAAHFATVFHRKTGLTPSEFRSVSRSAAAISGQMAGGPAALPEK